MKFKLLYKYLIIFLIPLSIIQPVKADKKAELAKWGLKSSKDIKKLKSKEIKSLIEGNILGGTYDDNTQSGPIEDTYYKNGTYVSQAGREKGKWKVSNGKLCYDPGGCVKVYKSTKGDIPVYFLQKYGILYTKFNYVVSIDERKASEEKAEKERLANEKLAKEKKLAEEKLAKEKKLAEEKKLKDEQKKIDDELFALRAEVKKESSKSHLPLCEDGSSNNSTRSTLQKKSKRWLNCFGGLVFDLTDGGTTKYIGEFGPNIGQSGHDQVAMPGAPGYFHGYGTYTIYNSKALLKKYVGQFYKGAISGQGTMYFKDGSRYEGMISNYEFNGAGKLFSPDGSIEKEGLWENGKLVQSKKIEIVEDKQLKGCSAVEEILKKNISEKVKTLGGYRHIHFGMSRDDVFKIGDCSNSNINKIQEAFDSNNFGIDSFNSGIILSGLYKYSLGIMFKKNDTGPGSTVDKIELKVLTKIRQKEYYSIGSSGIKEFEKLKDLLSDKYKLITEPSDISIDKYNSNPVRGTLSWVFKSNYNDNLIILELQGTRGMDGINYIYTGEVHYLSENQSKLYIEKIDSKKIKSDDL